MVKNKANSFFKTFITLCLVLLASCRTLCQNPQYDNRSFGIPGKADTIIDRPGYALGYSEYHEQAAWVIYIMTREEATTKEAQRTNRFRSDPQIPTGSATPGDYRRSVTIADTLLPPLTWPFLGKQWPTVSS